MVSKTERLRRRLQNEQKRLQDILTNADDPDLTTGRKEILNPEVDRIYGELNKYINEALDICDDEELTFFEEASREYAATYADIKEKIQLPKPAQSTVAPPAPGAALAPTIQSLPQARQDVRLPKIELKTFGGKLTEWTEFHDLFTVAIHNKADLENTMKFQYLKGALKGEAAELLRHLKVTDANYTEALRILKETYENQREIVYTHVRTLLKLENKSLKQFVNDVNSNVRALTALHQPTAEWDAFLNVLVLDKLDSETKERFEMTLPDQKVPSNKTLMDFLQKKVKANGGDSRPSTSKPTAPRSTNKCSACTETHLLHQCDKFKRMSLAEKRTVINRHNLCYNCLSPKHKTIDCPSTKCRKCGKTHHTLLHEDRTQPTTSVPPNSGTQPVRTFHVIENQDPVPAPVLTKRANSGSIVEEPGIPSTLLPTALVDIKAPNGQLSRGRSYSDTCSQHTLVSEAFVRRAGLKKVPWKMNLGGVATRTRAKWKVTLEIYSTVDGSFVLTTVAFVVPEVSTRAPSAPINPEEWSHLTTVKLADPTFHVPGEVDILLGIELWAHIIQEGILRTAERGLIAEATLLGWVVMGKMNKNALESEISVNQCLSIDETLTKFWEVETIPERRHFTTEEETCEEIYKRTVVRRENGRYQVSLPLTPDATLGNSKGQAVQRLLSLEKRLATHPQLKIEYSECIAEYLRLGHMERVPTHEINNSGANYLPHHAVIKETSQTTKLRVVFDASARTTNGKSLNDIMLNGPVLQDDIFTMLVRFRIHPVVLTADIEKMYRQIYIDPEQADLQRIVWKENHKIEHYRLLRLTFGTKAAPYLAVRTLHQLSEDEASTYPRGAPVLHRDMYVDNLLTGANTVEEARALRDELIQLTNAGGFPLRQWASNKKELLNDLEDQSIDKSLQLDHSGTVATLGLQWQPKKDIFFFKGNGELKEQVLTKRILLSEAARIFDPLGFLSPTTVKAKIIFQQLWLQPLTWDDPLPPDIQHEWRRYQRELTFINNIQIQRQFAETSTEVTLCGFSDASEKAYSAVVYARAPTPSGGVSVEFVAAKTKVAPLKTMTLPRLELCGALLLARLVESIVRTTKIKHKEAWTDSTVVLAWLTAQPSQWKSFIANRTAEIQGVIPPNNWHHISGSTNPADCASRGLSPKELVDHELWWKGPSFLRSQEWQCGSSHEPLNGNEKQAINRERKKSRPVVNLATTQQAIYSNSTFRRLIRVTAYVHRFVNNVRARVAARKITQNSEHFKVADLNRAIEYVKFTHETTPFQKTLAGAIKAIRVTAQVQRFVQNLTFRVRARNRQPLTGPLTTHELNLAENYHIRLHQAIHYPMEIYRIKNKGKVHPSSNLHSLAPYLDKDGILRVGGRLERSALNANAKHPIILPPKAELTKSIIRQYHRDLFHAGPSLLLSFLNHKYWLPGARNTIKGVLRSCVTCVRHNQKTIPQRMADLPADRLTPSRTFTVTGVDYAGPFYLKQMNKRSFTTTKGYLALFVCLATKAVHLEIVSDMSTPTFLAALRRFISRRGKPHTMRSDCGSNFVGAANELKALLKELDDEIRDEAIANMLSNQGINWQRNPPSAPHFGGLWEAAVKSFKFHFKRVVGETKLNFEEFNTLSTQVEAILNSRPLCSKTDTHTDPEALTPGHFLIGAPLVAHPEPDLEGIPENRLTRWQLVQALQQRFWRRWKNEYLTVLQRRYKWHAPNTTITKDQIVILKDVQLPPSQWLLGKITEVYPGPDKLVRVVKVTTAKAGEFVRPVTKLVLLPTS